MESSQEGRLGLQKLNNFSWKGRTFSQIISVIEKNKNTETRNLSYFRALPLKIYRKEIASNVLANNSSKKVSFYPDMPGSTVVNTASKNCNGKVETLDINYEETKQVRPYNANDECLKTKDEFKNSKYLNSLNVQDSARRRVRSAGMSRPRFNTNKLNKADSYSSASQYMHSRNKTFKQNQFHNLRIESADTTNNVYSSNTIQFCGTDDTKTRYVPVYYKPNNEKFSQQGAVDASSRLARLKYDTITDVGAKMRDAFNESTANALAYGVPANGYTIKDKKGYPNICTPVITKSGIMKRC